MSVKYPANFLGTSEYAVNILDSFSDALITLDQKSRVIYANKESCRLFGLDLGEPAGKSIADLMPTADYWRFQRHLEKAISDGVQVKLDNFKFFKKRFMVYFYPNSNGITILLHDNTIQWHADELYRLALFLLDRLNESVYLVRSDGRLFHVNDETSRLLGYSRQELIHMKIFDIDPGVTEDVWESYFKRIKESIHVEFESNLRASDGRIIPVDVSANYVYLYDNEYYCVAARDITERKRVEMALRESEEKFKKFFEIPLIGNAITSLDKRFLRVNDKLCKMFGYSQEELLKISWDEITHPEDLPRNIDAFNRLIAGEIETYTFEKRFIHKNGSVVYVILSVECIRREDGKVDYFISNYNDITIRKHGEIALQEAKNQAEIYLDLMGHDINNLNQVALGYLELANDKLKDEEVRELISKPIDAISSSSNLIENVRKLQKSKTDGHGIHAIDLNDVLSDLTREYSQASDKVVKIELTSSPKAFVMANGLIKDIFSNLIGNAIKHSNDIKPIHIKIRSKRVVKEGKASIMVAIEDNGPGIPDAMKSKLFNRFQRGNTKTTGKGLGLYLVKTLVDDFHGTVWAEDRVSGDYTKGSRFVVMLPAAEK